MDQSHKAVPLHEYIAQFGDMREAARVLGVTERCVRGWRYREHQPRVKDIPRLIRRSGGVLTFESFFAREQLQDIQHD